MDVGTGIGPEMELGNIDWECYCEVAGKEKAEVGTPAFE